MNESTIEQSGGDDAGGSQRGEHGESRGSWEAAGSDESDITSVIGNMHDLAVRASAATQPVERVGCADDSRSPAEAPARSSLDELADALESDRRAQHPRDRVGGRLLPSPTRPISRRPPPPPPARPVERGGPGIDELLRATYDSLPPPKSSARNVDPLFTTSALYEQMLASMSPPPPPATPVGACVSSSAARAGGQPRTSPPSRPQRRKRSFLAIAAACLTSFALGVVCTLVVEGGAPSAGAATHQGTTGFAPAEGVMPVARPIATDVRTDGDDGRSTMEPTSEEAPPPELQGDQRSVVTTDTPPSQPFAGTSAPASSPPTEPEADVDEIPPPESDASEPKPRPFDKGAAAAAVAGAAAQATGCSDGQHKGRAVVSVTFASSGRATSAVVAGDSSLAGTAVGSCIARAMRTAQVPPFDGGLVTVTKTVHVR